MRKYLFLLIFLFIPSSCYGAIASGTVLDISINGGNDNNGGGYSAYNGTTWSGTGLGTDYSNQDLAEATFSDLATTGVGSQISTVIGGMPTDATGNIIHIRGGDNFLPGFYQVISIQTGNLFTVDRNCTIGIGANGVGNLGGRLSTLWYPQNTATGPVVAGNTIYIKSGTYVKVGASAYVLSCSVAGGNGTPITWIGYNSSRTDEPKDDTRPLLSGDSDSNGTADTANCITVSVTGNIFKFIKTTKSTTANITTSSNGSFYFCRATLGTLDGFYAGSASIFIGCESDNNGSEGFTSNTSGSVKFIGCYSHDNTTEGFENAYSGGGVLIAISCIADTNKSHGFVGYGSVYKNCVAYNNTGASTDGFRISNSNSAVPSCGVINCISQSNGKYGFNRNATTYEPTLFDYNSYNGNGTAGLNNITAGANDSTADPLFTDPANGDFTFKSGSPCLGTGFPQTFMGATGDYQWNIGLDQGDHQTLSGGSCN